MIRRFLPLVVFALALCAQKYEGPRPAKPDLPYLKQADQLIPTEAAEAKEEKQKGNTIYSVEGAGSAVRTPLASPIFLFQAEKIVPQELGLYKLEVRNGRREIIFRTNRAPKPIRVDVTNLDGNLYKIEVSDTLPPGEYALSPQGSNQVFCFAVY